MKIKKSDVNTAVRWIETQLDKNDHFPFQSDLPKAAKKHLKALKAWRQCAANSKDDIRNWCDEWLDEEYQLKLERFIVKSHSHKADQTIKLTQEACDLLIRTADIQEKTPSELLTELLSDESSPLR